MEENRIIDAKFTKMSIPVPLFCFSVIALTMGLIKANDIYQNDEYQIIYSYYPEVFAAWFRYKEDYTFLEFFKKYFFEEGFGVNILIGLALLLLSIFVFWRVKKCSLTVSDKRIYGKKFLGSQFDLPIENVLGVSGNKAFKGFTVSTSSKTLRFFLVKNASDIHKEISSLIMSRTNENTTVVENKETDNNTAADELKKFKDLLDVGAITQEEFDAKKKQLLGL